jgi:putative membrane protein
MVDYDGRSWLRVALQVRGSVLPRIAVRVALALALGAAATYTLEKQGFKIPSLLHTLIGAALGLLLVFRTNASYDRWWEGRRLLGNLVNRSRDLARQIASYVPEGPDAGAEGDRAKLRRWTVLFYRLGAQSLRAERELAPVASLMTHDERAKVEAAAHRPVVVHAWISKRLAELATEGALTEQRLQVMDANLGMLHDALGGCERIVKTPVPFAYAQHSKLLVTLFCFTLPFAMSETLGWLTPLGSGLVAFALFGVDEIGVEIEDPFGHDPNDLPVDAIGDTIERNLGELLPATAATLFSPGAASDARVKAEAPPSQPA